MDTPLPKNFKAGYAAIVGQPNVGKSTLLNALLNFKVSSVTPRPQTTRHQIRGILNGENYQIIFLDTPGILQPKYKLQEAMLNAVQRSLQDADAVMFMVEAAEQPDTTDVEQLEKISQSNQPVIIVINKIDLIAKDAVLPLMDFYQHYDRVKALVPISALNADGLDLLKEELLKVMPNGFPFYATDQIVDHPERFIVAEIIREKVFQRYGEEIPYSTTVSIDEFKEREHSKDFIRATIYVERASQKGILIGKKGAALKAVGRFARESIELILGRQVYLELWVKVREKWRQDERFLKESGYYN